jgi:hypothetical protein
VPSSANCTTPLSCDRLDDLNKPRLAPPQMSSKNVRRIVVSNMLDLLAARFMLVPCMVYSLTMKVEAICSSETSVDFHRTTRRYIAEFIFSTLKMEAICSSETSVDTQRTTRRYTPDDCTFHF